MTEEIKYSEKMQQLVDLAAELEDLGHITALMGWDQQVYMPRGGSEERGQQSSLIGRLMHEKFTSDEVGKLLADLEAEVGDLTADTDEARSVKVFKKAYEKQTKVPLPLLMEFIKVTTGAHEAWVEARTKSDFTLFQPYLQKIVDLRIEYAKLFQPYDNIYDALLDDFEPGMKTADVKEIFDKLRPQQVEFSRQSPKRNPLIIPSSRRTIRQSIRHSSAAL